MDTLGEHLVVKDEVVRVLNQGQLTENLPAITAVQVPEGCDADKVRQLCLDKFNVSLGGGLDRLKGHVFRIGHLGDLNEPMILGALAAVEMALELSGVPHGKGGVAAAMDYLVAAE